MNCFGRVSLLIKCYRGLTLCICHRVIETLGFVVLECDNCCGETVVCIFVRMEVGGMDCQCVSVVS